MDPTQLPEKPSPGEKAKAVMMGQVPPPNDMAAYIVEQSRKARLRMDNVKADVAKLEEQLSALKNEALRLEGVVVNYQNDLVHWVEREEQTKETPVAGPVVGPDGKPRDPTPLPVKHQKKG